MSSVPSSFSEAQIASALDDKFPLLRFPAGLERAYREQKLQRLVARGVIVSLAAFFLNLAYVLSDLFLLPDSVGVLTIAIRAGVLLPLVAIVLIAGYLKASPRLFFRLYYLAYLVGGLSVISISVIAQMHSLAIPYEGLLLIMMFGYLVMGIPFYHALAGAMLMFVVFVATQIWLGLSPMTMLYNAFFIMTANIIGAIGCYMQERGERRNYLSSMLLAKSRDRAETESERKTRMLAEASHDLRQPLHAMTLMLEGLSSQSLTDSARSMLENLKTALANLNRMLATLLDMSSIESGNLKPTFSDFELSAFLEELVLEYQYVPVRLECTIKGGESGVFIRSDKVLLSRLLRNLIENACKHAGASEIVVKLIVEGAFVELSVEDNGCGMDEETQSRVFEAFYRNASQDSSGLGLGLAIVQELASLLELDLRLHSDPGFGSCFVMRLAMASKRRIHSSAIDKALPVYKGLVLVADDDEVILASLTTLLSGWGYEVESVSTLDSLRDSMLTRNPVAVISDAHFRHGGPSEKSRSLMEILMMPEVYASAIPILVVTGDTRLDHEHFDYPLLELLYKPVAPAKLRLVLTTLMQAVESG